VLIKVGSRGSRLAVLQAESVIRRLRRFVDAEFSVVKIKTLGDSPRCLQMLGSGIFEKDVDDALIRGEIDLAVHSMKDVPTDIPGEIVLAAVPERLPANDVFVSPKYGKLSLLPEGGVIGTSSPRRAAQLRSVRQDLRVVSLRGNIETRLRRLGEDKFDGIILAQAALVRIGGLSGSEEILPIEHFPTSPGQGALAIMVRKGDREMLGLAGKINCAEALEEITAERSFLSTLGCGCSSPVGCTASVQGQSLLIHCGLYTPDGKHSKTFSFEFERGVASHCGEEAARRVLGDAEACNFWR
jgi:hydroxymethylbilane synthase